MRKGKEMAFGGWVPLLLLLAAVVLCALPRDVRATSSSPKPLVMLLLDTSGSMQYIQGINGEFPTCHETRQEGFDYLKSRWGVATEVFTGSFNEYWCTEDQRIDDPNREDYMAAPPHYQPEGIAVEGQVQRPDGMLDIYRDSIKFGLMTFDQKWPVENTAAGGYSYGPNRPSSPFGTWNVGARSEAAEWGKLVVPSSNDNLGQIRNGNDDIQEQILLSKPWGHTPLSPLLDDALFMFQTDNAVKPYDESSDEGDPYYDCRSKSVILLTDGQPDQGENIDGYDHSYEVATNLLTAGITVYVIGYELPPATPAAATLNKIAEFGGSGQAYIVDSPAELVTALGEILVAISANQPAKVRTAVSNRTLSTTDLQYQFNASYSGTAVSPLDMVGHLDQFIYRCDDDCAPEDWPGGASLCEVFSISNALDARTDEREIFTQVDGVVLPFAADTDEITAELLALPTEGVLPRLDPYELPGGQTLYSGLELGDASDETIRAEYREQLIRLVAADEGSRREGIRMGAIANSEPVVQTNLFSLTAPLPSFIAFRNQAAIRSRPTVLFAGTHDGLMHAFRIDRLVSLDESDYGTELWSFIPKHLLGQVDRLASGMAYLMDGKPVVAEVRLSRESANVPVEEEIEQWRSVLMSGYGEGGRGFFCLNVTNPEEFDFMWEISNTERCYMVEETGNACVPTTDFQRLGLSYGRPAIGEAFFSVDGELQQRGIAIFTGGRAVDGEDQSGKAVFVVDLESGQLIREFCNSCGNVFDTNTVSQNNDFLDCSMEGPIAAYDAFIGGVITRAFIGDSCGQLWRLDIGHADPADWRLEFFHDAFANRNLNHPHRRPLGLQPSIAVSVNPGRLVVVYGTGSPDEVLMPGRRDRVYSVSEFWNGSSIEAQINWELILDNREAFTSDPLIFDQAAFFTTQSAAGGMCNAGLGRLWGIDYVGDDPDEIDDLVAAMDEDGDPATLDLANYVEFENSELLGLQLIQRPSCFDQASNYQPWTGGVEEGSAPPSAGSPHPGAGVPGGPQFSGSSGGGLELVVQTGSSGVSSPEMQPPEGGGAVSTGNKAVQRVNPPSQTVFSTSWGLVFD